MQITEEEEGRDEALRGGGEGEESRVAVENIFDTVLKKRETELTMRKYNNVHRCYKGNRNRVLKGRTRTRARGLSPSNETETRKVLNIAFEFAKISQSFGI